MEAVGRVCRKGRHEDRLVEGLLQSKCCVWEEGRQGRKEDESVLVQVQFRSAGLDVLRASLPKKVKKKALCCYRCSQGRDAPMLTQEGLPGRRRLGNCIFRWKLMAPFQLTVCIQPVQSTLHTR